MARSLPKTMVGQIMKDSVPSTVKVSEEAVVAMAGAASQFVGYCTYRANQEAEYSKTSTGEDVISAIRGTRFDEMVGPLEESLSGFRAMQESRKQQASAKKREKAGKDKQATKLELPSSLCQAAELELPSSPTAKLEMVRAVLEGQEDVVAKLEMVRAVLEGQEEVVACEAECSDSPVKTSQQVAKVEKTKKSSAISTLAQFAAAQKFGKWSCSACLTTNPDTVLQCAACEGAKPGHEGEVAEMKKAAKMEDSVMIIGESGGFKFGGAPATTQASGFSFGSPAADTTTAASFSCGYSAATPAAAAGSGFSFSSPASSTTPFGAAAKEHQFNLSGAKSPEKNNMSVGGESKLNQEEKKGNMYFKPVIPQPGKVDLATADSSEAKVWEEGRDKEPSAKL